MEPAMTFLDTPELPKTPANPSVLLGAASPLWAYFGAAAAGGVAFWWMTRWGRPVNLEALFAGAAKPVEAALDAVDTAAKAVVEAVPEVVAPPVGGEAGPVSPVLALVETPPPEPEPQPVEAAVPETEPPAMEAAAEAPREPKESAEAPKKAKATKAKAKAKA
jgi:hypothetical protein